MNHKYFLRFSVVLILLNLVACVLPGQAPPMPTIDMPAVETSIAGTATAGYKTPTPTVIPTETTVPTPAISTYGTSVYKNSAGATVFADHRAGIQLTFPVNWLAMRVGEPEYYQAWEKEGARNPAFLEVIIGIQNLDLNRFRISAFDMNPDHLLHGNFPKINVVFIQDDARTLRQVEADERSGNSVLKNYKYLPPEYGKTASGMDILMIHHQWESADQTQTFMGYYRGFLFKVPTGTVAIDLFIPLETKDLVEPELKQIVESVTLLVP